MAVKPQAPPRHSLRKRAFTGHRVWDGPSVEASGPSKKRLNRRIVSSATTLVVLPLFIVLYLRFFNDTYSVSPPPPTHQRVYQWVSAPPTDLELRAIDGSRVGRMITTAAAHRIADKTPLTVEPVDVSVTTDSSPELAQ